MGWVSGRPYDLVDCLYNQLRLLGLNVVMTVQGHNVEAVAGQCLEPVLQTSPYVFQTIHDLRREPGLREVMGKDKERKGTKPLRRRNLPLAGHPVQSFRWVGQSISDDGLEKAARVGHWSAIARLGGRKRCEIRSHLAWHGGVDEDEASCLVRVPIRVQAHVHSTE
jgi:hypothetical protein